MTDQTWNPLLRDQLAWHWTSHLRDRLDGLTDEYAPTAAAALAQLDAEYATWLAGIASLGEAGLASPCGQAEGSYADRPLAVLVLHINREMIHHLAEVCLLRDLCQHTHQHTRQEAS